MLAGLKNKILTEYNGYREFQSLEREVTVRPGREAAQRPGGVYGGALDRPAIAHAVQDPIEHVAEGNLLQYFRLLWLQKTIIVLACVAGGIAGLMSTMNDLKVYQAHVSLEVQDINQDFPNIKAQGQTYFALSDIPTQVRLLQSSDLIQRTRAKMSEEIRGVRTFTNYAPVPWWRWFHLPEPVLRVSSDDLIADAAGSVRVHSSSSTRIIDVFVDSIDPPLAAKFANVLADAFIDQNIEARWKMSQRTGDWLTVQLEKTRNKLEGSEAALQAYARNVGLLFTGMDTGGAAKVSDEKLREVQASLSAATADRVAKQSRFEIAGAASPDGLPDVLNDPSLHENQSKITELKRQIADLAALYTADYPKVKRLEAQLRSVESAYEMERSAVLSRIKNDYEEARRREQLLTGEYTDQARLVTSDSEKAIQYTILKREVDSNRQLYDAMLERVKQTGIASALRASNIRIVDQAATPAAPYTPQPKVNAGIGVLAGLLFGCIFAIIRERSNRSFRSPGQTPGWLNVPELGVIPSGNSRIIHGLMNGRRRIGGARPLPRLVPDTDSGSALGERPELVTLHRKSSLMADAFRIVLPHIVFPGNAGNGARATVITSAHPAEGKTMVACNLAITLSEIGKRVLLVDADLRRPNLHKVFALDNSTGLSDLLNGVTADDAVLHNAIKATPSENLSVLPSGPAIPNAGKTLFAQQLAELLTRLKREFEIVLIDAPPILQLPDARVLGSIADGVILVVRAGYTTRESAAAACKSLTDLQCYVLGTILNNWDPRRSPFGYDSRYASR